MLCCDWLWLIFSPKILAIIQECLLGKDKRAQELFCCSRNNLQIAFIRVFQGILLELGQRKHMKFYIACRLYWNSTVKLHFLNSIFNTLPLLYKFESLSFQMQDTGKGGGWGLDSYSEISYVSSSCLDASYKHALACSTQSPKRILPLSYFIFQPERGYKSIIILLTQVLLFSLKNALGMNAGSVITFVMNYIILSLSLQHCYRRFVTLIAGCECSISN